MTFVPTADFERLKTRVRAPGKAEDEVSAAKLRIPPAMRQAQAEFAAVMRKFGSRADVQRHPRQPELQMASAAELDLAILADLAAGTQPLPAIAALLRALAAQAAALSNAYEARLARSKGATNG